MDHSLASSLAENGKQSVLEVNGNPNSILHFTKRRFVLISKQINKSNKKAKTMSLFVFEGNAALNDLV